MIVYFIRHNFDDSPYPWIAVVGESGDVIRNIDAGLMRLKQRTQPSSRRSTIALERYEHMVKSKNIWKDAVSSANYTDFTILTLKGTNGEDCRNIASSFNHPLRSEYRITNNALYRNGKRVKTEKVNAVDVAPVHIRNWVKKIFFIKLKNDPFKFWYTARNEDVPRTKREIAMIGCHYLTNYINRINKRKNWTTDGRTEEVLAKVQAIARAKLGEFRKILKDNPDLLEVGFEKVKATSPTMAVSEINKNAFEDLIASVDIDKIVPISQKKVEKSSPFSTSWLQNAFAVRPSFAQ